MNESDCGTDNQVQTIAFDGPAYVLPVVVDKEGMIANKIGPTVSVGMMEQLRDVRTVQIQVTTNPHHS